MIIMIAAVTDNHVIGHHGAIPWHMPADLRYFKTVTMGHTVLMGRKTYESIIEVLGKPLPGRQNVVLTRDTNFVAPAEVTVVRSIEAALTQFPDATIIGGATLYEQFMPHSKKLIMTEVHTTLEGDTFFPAIDSTWKETLREDHGADDKNKYDYSFVTYERF